MEELLYCYFFCLHLSSKLLKHSGDTSWLVLHPSLGQRLALIAPFVYKIKLKRLNRAPSYEFEAQMYGI